MGLPEALLGCIDRGECRAADLVAAMQDPIREHGALATGLPARSGDQDLAP